MLRYNEALLQMENAAASASAIHAASLVFDGHCDTLLEVVEGRRQLEVESETGHLDLPRLQRGGVTGQVFAICAADAHQSEATEFALRMIDAFYQTMEAAPDTLRLALTAADVEAAKTAGQIAGVLGLEGAEPLAGDLGLLRIFYRLGVRLVGLTWNHRNQAADGVAETITGGGLTEFGRQLVAEMNRLGMVIDIAHLSPAGVQDVLQVSQTPVIASHANAAALCPHRRNLTDEQLTAVAAKGGVVGVTFVPQFLDSNSAQATIDRVLDHIDYLVKVMGADHVALGSDFDGFTGQPPAYLGNVTELPNLTLGLLARGYNEETIGKILGGNLLRVFRQVAG